MPQASDESRASMKAMFGDAIDDHGPIRFLESRGYSFVGEGGVATPYVWHKPNLGHEVTDDEWACLTFLMDEWDFAIAF
jgi:hypothetical protein